MNISTAWKLLLAAALMVMLAVAPRAIADDLETEAEIPDSSTLGDPAPADQVLEIPQQCDQDAVAALCDRTPATADASMSSDLSDPTVDADANLPADTAVGSLSDYANQTSAVEASATGTMNVPVGFYPRAELAPSPMIVSSAPDGPGAYQQWARGPGSYRMMAPGPGYIQPMPLGFHPSLGPGFAAHSFMMGRGMMGGGHFGRR